MSTKFTISFIAVVLAPLAAFAQPTCLDKGETSTIEATIQILPSLSAESACSEDSRGYKLLEALTTLKSMALNMTALPSPLNTNLLPGNFWNYFTDRIWKIDDALKTDPVCNSKVVGYVALGADDHTMHLCSFFYSDAMSVYNRIQVLLHEARHVEGFAHVTCTRGINKALEGACDQKIQDHGSYAISVEALVKMALLDDRVLAIDKKLNMLNALAYANNAFNEPVGQESSSAIYLADADDKNGFIFDGTTLTPAPAYLASGSVFSLINALEVFPDDQSQAYVLDSMTLKSIDIAQAATAYYNEQHPGFVPLTVYNQKILAILMPTQLSLLTPTVESKFKNVQLQFQSQAVFFAEELGLQDNGSVFVTSRDGRMFAISTVDPNQIRPVANAAQGFVSLITWDKQRFGLTTQGNVVILQAGQWIEVSALKGHRFRSMSRSFEWSSYFYQNQ